MQRRIITFKWLLAAWLLLICCTQPTRAVSYKPAYINTNGYNPAAYTTMTQMQSVPDYQFRSTSPYTPTIERPEFVPLADNPFAVPGRPGIRKGLGGEEEDPVGQVTRPPVGEPWILLVFALLYLLYMVYKKKTILTK